MVGDVCTTSFIKNWYKIVVLPALSSPTMQILCSEMIRLRLIKKEKKNCSILEVYYIYISRSGFNIINKLLNKSITIDDAFNGDIYNSFFGRITLLTNINLKLIHVRFPWSGSNETRSPTDGCDERGLLQTAA